MFGLFKAISRMWWRFLGYNYCPLCGGLTVMWVKDVVLYEDEPPMFGHWECMNRECGGRTVVEATPLLDKAARELGYDGYKGWLEDQEKELEGREGGK